MGILRKLILCSEHTTQLQRSRSINGQRVGMSTVRYIYVNVYVCMYVKVLCVCVCGDGGGLVVV